MDVFVDLPVTSEQPQSRSITFGLAVGFIAAVIVVIVVSTVSSAKEFICKRRGDHNYYIEAQDVLDKGESQGLMTSRSAR